MREPYFYFIDAYKGKLRHLDKAWCYRNIPSSIVWNTEIHHDWENEGIMYLLSHKDHLAKGKPRNIRDIDSYKE